jgi:hypothetical protein
VTDKYLIFYKILTEVLGHVAYFMLARDVMKERRTETQTSNKADRKQDRQTEKPYGWTDGWLNRWKNRHVISNDNLSLHTQ